MPRMSRAKRNAIARLRRAVRPLLYPTGIVDESQPDGRMRLYLFQHGPGGDTNFWNEPHPIDRPEHGVRRKIDDRYRHGIFAGGAIIEFFGFCDGGIVDDICVGITTYPFSGLSLRTLRSMTTLVAKIKRYERDEESQTWRPRQTAKS